MGPDADVSTRLRLGARRGALAGVYFFVILFVIDRLQRRDDSYVARAPLTAAAAVIVGFVIGGLILFAGVPRVTSTLRAVGLGIASAYPAMLGLVIATVGWRLAAPVAALVSAVLVGATGGVMIFRGWYRRRDRS